MKKQNNNIIDSEINISEIDISEIQTLNTTTKRNHKSTKKKITDTVYETVQSEINIEISKNNNNDINTCINDDFQNTDSKKANEDYEDNQTEIIEVYSLVPSNSIIQNDMERIADMKEQFSQSIDPILRMYNSAMSVTKSRLEIIQDEFNFRKLRNPIHHIETRLKSARSILGKLQKKELELSLGTACNNIFDIAGIRVVCPYIKDVYLIRDRIMSQDDIEIMRMKDYIESPKPNGYRSLHMTIRVPVYFMNKKQMVPVELQIRTMAMDLWASLEHDIKYKCLYQNKSEDIDFDEELKECSLLIYAAEEKLEKMNYTLERFD